jgi:hypothetical protein
VSFRYLRHADESFYRACQTADVERSKREKLQHDPRTKGQIKDALYDLLYLPVQRQFKARIETLITRNTVMGGYSHKHFVYKGVVYNAESTPAPIKKNRLLPTLRADMEEYLADLHRLNAQELPYVLEFINRTLKSSNDFPDYLLCLPESMHHPLERLQATCPCRSTSLSDEKVEQLKLKNEDSIALIRQRLVRNLLLI